MQELQLFIGTQRVDLFKDETVSITQTIQNVRDIDKIFTDFTKTFNVPASKKNNQIFKHYYNFDIDNGFDARFRVDSTLEINTLPFKQGKVRLESVSLSNQKAHTYKITFFGNTVELKDLLGSDKISDLNLDAYKQEYDADTVETLLKADPATNDVIAPLITHTQRLYYDSNDFYSVDGNLFSQGDGGVQWSNLKYALKLNRIIEQIEIDYGLTFSSDFFKDPNNKVFENLFIWMHRKSGEVERLDTSTTTFETRIVGWPSFVFPDLGPPFYAGYGGMVSQITNVMADCNYFYAFEVILQTTTTLPYTVVLKKYDGNSTSEVYRVNKPNGGTFTGDFLPVSCGGVGYFGNGTYSVWIEATTAITFSQCDWNVNYDDTVWSQSTGSRINTPFTTDVEFIFYPQKQLPNIKTIDFLNGLFRMFNLTAFKVGEVIQVIPLKDFYANNFKTYDITEYVDTNRKSVDNALPFRQLNIKYAGTATFLANKYDELVNKDWGAIEYRATVDQLDGKVYNIIPPFEHMQFERLNDASTGALKDLQYGYSVNDDQSPYIGKPLLFYPIQMELQIPGIAYVYQVDDDGNSEFNRTIYSGNMINLPSNSVSFDPTITTENIHFENETNEWTRTNVFTRTLFNEYYEKYITDAFNLKRRLTKVTAYLPIRIFTNLNLNDRIVINDKSYIINQVTTNLLTGKSQFELLNEV